MAVKVLVVDNYDSFTYNLVHYLQKVKNTTVSVCKNDAIDSVKIANYDKILFSPGPGLPSEAGAMNELIKEYASQKAILGICLGMQAIGEVFGAKLKNLNTVFHGVSSTIIQVKNDSLFTSIPIQFEAGRYHSWVIDKSNFPASLEIICQDEHKNCMAIRHKKWDVKGVQFHPESILTPYGFRIIQNWIKL